MNKNYIIFLIIIIGLCNACSIDQEFIVERKTKKTYVSQQQDVELDGDIVAVGTDVTGVLADLSKTIFLITKSSLNRVNAYIDGEKNNLNKVERTKQYKIKMKIVEELGSCITKIEESLQRLNSCIALLDEKNQAE